MKAKIKYVKLLEENGDYGFEVALSTVEGIKKFGGITDKGSFRKLFFGILSVCNNYDLSDLSKIKGRKISAIMEHPDTFNQRIASIGNRSKFLINDKNNGFVIKKFNYKEKKLLKSIKVIQTGKIVSIRSASGTICMLFKFKGCSQGTSGPNLYTGMAYPLNKHTLTDEEAEFVANNSCSYIAGLIKVILNTKYLYHEKKNKQEYNVDYTLDELGNVVSIGNLVEIDNRMKPVYINRYDNEYRLEETPLQIEKANHQTLKKI